MHLSVCSFQMRERLVYGTQTCVAGVGQGGRLLDVCGPLGMDRRWVLVGLWVVGVGRVSGYILGDGLGVGPEIITKHEYVTTIQRNKYLFNGRAVSGHAGFLGIGGP